MFRLPELGGGAADRTAGFHQFLGVQGPAAGVALVAPGAGVLAIGAGPLHVPVGQVADTLGAVGQQHVGGVDVALVVQRLENVVDHFLVVRGVGGGEQVEGDAQLLPGLQEHGVVAFHHFLGGDAFLVRPDGDGGAVSVAAGDHQDVVALHAVVTGEDVGAQVAAGDMTQVKWTVGVGPSHGDENTLRDAFRQGGSSRYDLRIG